MQKIINTIHSTAPDLIESSLRTIININEIQQRKADSFRLSQIINRYINTTKLSSDDNMIVEYCIGNKSNDHINSIISSLKYIGGGIKWNRVNDGFGNYINLEIINNSQQPYV